MPAAYRRRRAEDDVAEDLEEILGQIGEDVLEHGDVTRALEDLMRSGFVGEDGEHVEGLDALLERVRARRRELEDRVDSSSPLDRYAQWLEHVERLEAEGLERSVRDAHDSGDTDRADSARRHAESQNLERALWGSRFAERFESASHYEFSSPEAAEEFSHLEEELRRDLAASYFDAAKEALSHPDPVEMARLRDMMNELSELLERRRRGEDVSEESEEFLRRYQEYFPGASTLDDAVRQLAERGAAAEAMFRSLSADEQGQLRQLMGQLTNDADFDWALHRLMSNLRHETPDLDWSHVSRGTGSGGFSEAVDTTQSLSQLREIESFLARSGAALALPEVDVDQIRTHLGDDAARHVERLRQTLSGLRDRGYLTTSRGEFTLTPRALSAIGKRALRDLFADAARAALAGGHTSRERDVRGEREETSRTFESGDLAHLHVADTLRNALRREGPGLPLTVAPEDFVVHDFEGERRSATVFAIDLSRSMALRGNLGPAKKMLVAMVELIRQRYPRDFLAVVGFSALAFELRLDALSTLTIDDSYGTNLQHALALGRHLMRDQRGVRQIVVVTDGEPTAHLGADGEPFFSWPPVHETLERTMAEVLRCTKAGIVINTFALDIERSQFPFVEQIARVNGGRTFYTSIDDLGAYVLDDFVTRRPRRAS
jgi:uncharacterized protein with von Willebrand factor type A (vWA) domain